MKNVVGLNEYRLARAYSGMNQLNINLALDNIPREKIKRQYAKELQIGYMRLLSNKQ
jgi:hypothetical protein